MLIRLLKTEVIKLRRSALWLIFLGVPVIPAALGSVNYMYNIEILKNEWYSLWTQHTLFSDYFFLPILIGVYCSYLMGLEYSDGGLTKILSMPVRRTYIYISKLITASVMVLSSIVWIGILFFISGKICGISSDFPFKDAAVWCGLGALGGIAMASLQLMLSVFTKSFGIPVAAALLGGVSGIAFLAKHMGHLYPYSLMSYGMSSNSPQQLYEKGCAVFVLACVMYIILFGLISSVYISKKDI